MKEVGGLLSFGQCAHIGQDIVDLLIRQLSFESGHLKAAIAIGGRPSLMT
jgi:hypothetical protein